MLRSNGFSVPYCTVCWRQHGLAVLADFEERVHGEGYEGTVAKDVVVQNTRIRLLLRAYSRLPLLESEDTQRRLLCHLPSQVT